MERKEGRIGYKGSRKKKKNSTRKVESIYVGRWKIIKSRRRNKNTRLNYGKRKEVEKVLIGRGRKLR